jgi:hypothetical protein
LDMLLYMTNVEWLAVYNVLISRMDPEFVDEIFVPYSLEHAEFSS